ncbi:MAG: hypothetical protein JWL74_1856, partial [Alphaproteobacteria bacterium]|nr:hypothetical protein [Alphaproteobacteria bacterium]
MLLNTLSFLLASFTFGGGAAEEAQRVRSATLVGRSVPAALASRSLPGPALAAATSAASSSAIQVSGLSDEGFQDYLPRLRQAALAEGVRPETIERIFPTLAFSP